MIVMVVTKDELAVKLMGQAIRAVQKVTPEKRLPDIIEGFESGGFSRKFLNKAMWNSTEKVEVIRSEFEKGLQRLSVTRKERELIISWLRNADKVPEKIQEKSRISGASRYRLLMKTVFVILNNCDLLDPIQREIAVLGVTLRYAQKNPSEFLKLLLSQESEIVDKLPAPWNRKLQLILRSFRKIWRIRRKPST